jgi:hypothetical protein
MSTLPANGQFDSSTLLSTCAPLTASELDNTGATSTTLLLPFTGSGSNKGLLGNYTSATATGVDPNSYMTFDKLNDPTQRMQWLQTRYATLLQNKVIPIHPQLPSVQNNLITPNGPFSCHFLPSYFNNFNAILRGMDELKEGASKNFHLNHHQS